MTALRLKNAARKALPAPLLRLLIDRYSMVQARRAGLTLRRRDTHFEIMSDSDRCIRISRRHNVYLMDMINNFDHYFSSVVPFALDGLRVVDFSTPRYHEVVGYDLHPVLFPSLAEPVATTAQYLEFAGLRDGQAAIDIGAYSGLTSILFDGQVAPSGRVVAVDADPQNTACLRKNFENYRRITGRGIDWLEAAVWEHCEGITFSCEGSMGSTVVDWVGGFRGSVRRVQTTTLSSIASRFRLERVDFIKCDIEGAESVIFRDEAFFRSYRPKIIVEPHLVDGASTTAAFVPQLSALGYEFREVEQKGSHLPLVECRPRET